MARTRATPTATSFGAPGGASLADVVGLLTERLAATAEAPTVEERTVLDTVDRDVRGAGFVIEATRAGERGTVIAVRRWGSAPDRLAVPIGGLPRRVDDLPSRFGERLPKGVRAMALVPLGTICVAVHPLAVRNEDDKVVVRVAVEAIDGPAFVRVQPLRGYAPAGARAIRTITGLGFRPGAEPVEALYATAPATAVAPAPSVPANRVWVHVLRDQLDVMEATLPGAIKGADAEDLHDFRVALRRSRAALRQSKGVLPKELRACFRPELTHLQRATGSVRDLEVLRDMLAERDDVALDALRAAVQDRLAAAREEMEAVLQGERTHALLADWRATLVALADHEGSDDADEWGPWPARARDDVTDAVTDRIIRQRQRLLALGRAITPTSPATDLHEVRKQGKELRYLVELFAEHVPETATPDAQKAMRSLQNNLGRHHDVAVQVELIRTLADDGLWSDRPALERLLAELEAAQSLEREKFTTRFARVVASVQHSSRPA